MKKPVAIALARDFVPAQRLLLPAILLLALVALMLACPGRAGAETSGQPGPRTRAIQPIKADERSEVKGTLPAAFIASASIRAANDLASTSDIHAATPDLPAVTGATSPPFDAKALARPPGRTVGLMPAAHPSAEPDQTPVTVRPRARPRSWYPEAHHYLRPYHYRWRYSTRASTL